MKAIDPKKSPASAGDAGEARRLLKEFFLNASLLAVMKGAVDETVYLERLALAVARAEDDSISAPAA